MENSETFQVIPTLVPFVLVIFVIALGVVLLNFQFRKNLFKKQLEQEELKQLHQQKLLENTVEIQEEERRRIAQDLHDELGAVLSISKMRLAQLESTCSDDEEIQAVKEHLEMALNSTRRISRELMPIHLEQLGLQKALGSLAHFIEEAITIDIDISVPNDQLSGTQQLGLYRIFSELIHNTLKYAEASEIHISLIREGRQLIARYRDNGKGIQLDGMKSGIGFQSIDNRIGYLQGSWEYGNHPEGGFHAHFNLPLEDLTILN